MAEFGASATLSVQVPDSELRAARAEIEDELGDLTVSVDAETSGGAGQAGGGVPMADGGSSVPGLLEEQVELLDEIEEHLDDSDTAITGGAPGASPGGGGDSTFLVGGGGGGGLLQKLGGARAMLAGGGATLGLSAMFASADSGTFSEDELQAIEEGEREPAFGIEAGELSHLPGEIRDSLESFEWPALPAMDIREPSQPDWVGRVLDGAEQRDTDTSGGREPVRSNAVEQLTESDQGSNASIRHRSNAPNIVVEDNTTVNVEAVRELERALDRKKGEIARDVERRLDRRVNRGLQR